MALLDESDWSSEYELMFSLWLERAECELLSGHFEEAEQLIAELLQRATSKVDEAGVYNLKVQLHVMKSEYQQAVDHRTHVPARVWHRPAGASDRGAGPERTPHSVGRLSMGARSKA